MTQEYRILWYEDSTEFVGSLIDPIREHVESLGFKFYYENKRDDAELNEEWLKRMDPDLILVDYGLGNGKKGDEVLEKIRVIERYADVVFYSKDYEDYIEKISRRIDGVFFTIRKELLVKTANVINRTVRKQQDPDNMRGVIIAEAIDIERKMDNFILLCLGSNTEQKNVIEKILDPEFDVLSFKKKFDLVNKICKERIRVLAESQATAEKTKKGKIGSLLSEIKEKKTIFADVEKEVIKIRNVMAHATQDLKTKCLTSYIIKEEQITVDDDFCKSTRRNLRKHSMNLDELTKLISSKN